MNVYEAVKSKVTTRQAAEYYGIKVTGRGMARCPFHHDRHPSMKLDQRFLRKNKPLNTTTLNDLCRILNCDIQEICRYIPSDTDQSL